MSLPRSLEWNHAKKATKFRLRKIFTCRRIKAPANGHGIVNENQAVSHWQGMRLLNNKHCSFQDSKKKDDLRLGLVQKRQQFLVSFSLFYSRFYSIIGAFVVTTTFVLYHFDDAVTTVIFCWPLWWPRTRTVIVALLFALHVANWQKLTGYIID